jgi:hypothetical protein
LAVTPSAAALSRSISMFTCGLVTSRSLVRSSRPSSSPSAFTISRDASYSASRFGDCIEN